MSPAATPSSSSFLITENDPAQTTTTASSERCALLFTAPDNARAGCIVRCQRRAQRDTSSGCSTACSRSSPSPRSSSAHPVRTRRSRSGTRFREGGEAASRPQAEWRWVRPSGRSPRAQAWSRCSARLNRCFEHSSSPERRTSSTWEGTPSGLRWHDGRTGTRCAGARRSLRAGRCARARSATSATRRWQCSSQVCCRSSHRRGGLRSPPCWRSASCSAR